MSPFLKYRIRDYPELALFEGSKEQKRALRKANREAARSGLVRMIVVAAICGGLYSGVLKHAVLRVLPVFPAELSRAATFACEIVVAALFFTPVFMLANRNVRKKVERSLRRQLVEKGIAVCIGCGYDLRGCRSGRCPECGLEFEEGDGDDSVG